jgi:hypothetical protein
VRVLEKDARRIEDVVSMSAELEDLRPDRGPARQRPHPRAHASGQKAPVSARPVVPTAARALGARALDAPKPAPHVLARYAAALAPIGVAVEGAPRIEAGAEAERWAEEWLAEWKPARGQPIALCPGAGRIHQALARGPVDRMLARTASRPPGHAVSASSTEANAWR